MRCPCRKASESVSYEACCGRYHNDGVVPPTAEALMRSRYSAFALKNEIYLLGTWHPRTRPVKLDFEVGRKWYMLKVLYAQEDGDEATVEFYARSRMFGRTHSLHEVSRFVREDGRWFYVDGKVAP